MEGKPQENPMEGAYYQDEIHMVAKEDSQTVEASD